MFLFNRLSPLSPPLFLLVFLFPLSLSPSFSFHLSHNLSSPFFTSSFVYLFITILFCGIFLSITSLPSFMIYFVFLRLFFHFFLSSLFPPFLLFLLPSFLPFSFSLHFYLQFFLHFPSHSLLIICLFFPSSFRYPSSPPVHLPPLFLLYLSLLPFNLVLFPFHPFIVSTTFFFAPVPLHLSDPLFYLSPFLAFIVFAFISSASSPSSFPSFCFSYPPFPRPFLSKHRASIPP